jgi:hypothetical protein
MIRSRAERERGVKRPFIGRSSLPAAQRGSSSWMYGNTLTVSQGGERSLLHTNVQADLSFEDGCREKPAKVGNLNDRGNQFVGNGSCHNAALLPCAESLQHCPDAPQVFDHLTHLIGRKELNWAVSPSTI